MEAKRKERRRSPANRRGSALLASMMVVMVVAGLGMCMVRMHSSFTRRQGHAIDKTRAFYVAEAGLSESFLAISQGKSGNVASAALPAAFGDGLYWVEAQELDDGNVTLKSTGMCGAGRFSLAVVLRSEVDPLASLGAFSHGSLVLQDGAVVDGYDSSLGPYAEQVVQTGESAHAEAGALLTSNADIEVQAEPAEYPEGGGAQPTEARTLVYGDAHPGPGAAVVLDPGALVSGSTTPASEPGELPEIELPQLAAQPAEVVSTGETLTLGAHQIHLTGLEVEARGRVELVGPLTLVVGELRLLPDAELSFDTTTGPITLYATRALDLRDGSRLSNVGEDPRAVSILIPAQEPLDLDGDGLLDPPLNLRSTGRYFGFLYAPHLALTIPRSLRVFGAAAAEQLSLEAGARLSVDRAMATGVVGPDALPRLIAWQVAELPDTPLVRVRLDPYSMLALGGIAPPPSADAPVEGSLDIGYFDGLGGYRTYSGPNAGFDWNTVSSVVSVTWGP